MMKRLWQGILGCVMIIFSVQGSFSEDSHPPVTEYKNLKDYPDIFNKLSHDLQEGAQESRIEGVRQVVINCYQDHLPDKASFHGDMEKYRDALRHNVWLKACYVADMAAKMSAQERNWLSPHSALGSWMKGEIAKQRTDFYATAFFVSRKEEDYFVYGSSSLIDFHDSYDQPRPYEEDQRTW